MPQKKKNTKGRLQRVSIRAELRNEPDWDRYAYALLQHVKLLTEQKGKTAKPKKKRNTS